MISQGCKTVEQITPNIYQTCINVVYTVDVYEPRKLVGITVGRVIKVYIQALCWSVVHKLLLPVKIA